MKRPADWLPWVLVVGLLWFGWHERTGRQDAGREVTRLTGMSDSLARASARVDTQYVRDTLKLWRTLTRYDSVRTTDTVMRGDTVFVERAAADAAVNDCKATVITCEQRVALRDQRILILSDSLPRAVAVEWRGKVTTARQRALTVGVVAGAIAVLLLK